ncbi:hypothetical protein M3Y97_01052200 [Aphelenchoides bicaudatus]|nr:hypothetical protein M3Y97_01052200 [Aphelenchoides bicaudatus]
MSNFVLKILVEVDYPNVNNCFNWKTARPSKGCQMPGYFVEIIGLLAKRLDVSTQFVRVEQLDSEEYANLTIQELILGSLHNETIDLYSAFFDNSTVYGNGFEVSLPVYFSESKFLAARVKTLSSVFAFFLIYDLYTWMLIFGTMIAFLIIGYWICRNVLPRLRSSKVQIAYNQLSWKMVRLELLQYEKIQEKFVSDI